MYNTPKIKRIVVYCQTGSVDQNNSDITDTDSPLREISSTEIHVQTYEISTPPFCSFFSLFFFSFVCKKSFCRFIVDSIVVFEVRFSIIT